MHFIVVVKFLEASHQGEKNLDCHVAVEGGIGFFVIVQVAPCAPLQHNIHPFTLLIENDIVNFGNVGVFDILQLQKPLLFVEQTLVSLLEIFGNQNLSVFFAVITFVVGIVDALLVVGVSQRFVSFVFILLELFHNIYVILLSHYSPTPIPI